MRCESCATGNRPRLLDADGVDVAISGKPGTLCHSYEGDWWPCTAPQLFVVQVERLEAIVAKLPTTEDGVPMTPGMEVFWLLNGEIMTGRVEAVRESTAHIATAVEMPDGWTPCYSSQEAAEAARGK